MMIFDGFDSLKSARRFAAHAASTFGLSVNVYEDADDAHAADPFPWVLTAPVVHVERTDDTTETRLAHAVARFSGVYAGT